MSTPKIWMYMKCYNPSHHFWTLFFTYFIAVAASLASCSSIISMIILWSVWVWANTSWLSGTSRISLERNNAYILYVTEERSISWLGNKRWTHRVIDTNSTIVRGEDSDGQLWSALHLTSTRCGGNIDWIAPPNKSDTPSMPVENENYKLQVTVGKGPVIRERTHVGAMVKDVWFQDWTRRY